METFDTIFGLKLAHLIVSTCEQFSINLKSVDITVQEAIKGAQLLVKHLKSQRSESKFDAFYMDVVHQASSKTELPSLPHARKAPSRYDHGQTPHRYSIPKDRHRHIFFKLIEVMVGEVERRFEQSDLQLAQEIGCLLPSAANGNVTEMTCSVSKYKT